MGKGECAVLAALTCVILLPRCHTEGDGDIFIVAGLLKNIYFINHLQCIKRMLTLTLAKLFIHRTAYSGD